MFLIAEANPSKFNISSKNLKKIKKFVKDMHGNLLNGDLYDIYLNGLREELRKEGQDEIVFKNKTFRDKYLEYIKWKI